MSTHVPGFQSFSGFFHHFVLAKLATSSIRVKRSPQQVTLGPLIFFVNLFGSNHKLWKYLEEILIYFSP